MREVSGEIDWREVLTGAADRAVHALRVLDADWGDETGWGADGTVTAAADKAAEDAALSYLAEAVPGATLCSEEAGVIEGAGDVLLIVDPVDGTNNAVRGIPYWAFSVAVVIEGTPVGGLVRNVPARHDLFGWVGEGADINGRPVTTSPVERLGDAVVCVQRPAEPSAFGIAQSVMAQVKLARLLGAAALDIAYVGAGVTDGYANPNTNPLFPFGEKVVDYAAGAVFLEVAGGVITDVEGNPLSFAPDLRAREPVVAGATPALHEALLGVLAAG